MTARAGMLEAIGYRDGDTPLTGWLARPAGRARGAVVIFPTISNVTPATEARAALLAEAGYLAFIADFYGQPIAGFEDAAPLAEALRKDSAIYRRRIAAAAAALRALPEADGLRMAAIGYCMGGQAVLEMARDEADLAAAISFHGLLDTALPARPGAVRARLLICHGDADPFVPRDDVLAFWQEMDEAGADWHFHSYGKVKHGFTDPESDKRDLDAVAYDRSADRQSWAAAMAFLDEIFGVRAGA